MKIWPSFVSSPAATATSIDAFWSKRTADLFVALASSADGLTESAAAERLKAIGRNAVADESSTTAVRLLLRQFESPLVLILLFGAGVSLALREWVDASIILAIVLGSTLLGFLQEYRASAAIAELKRRLTLTTGVVRGGVKREVPVGEIVPGDVIDLSAGNLVPADGLVIEARDFLVSESSLTGESFPVEKRPGVVAAEVGLSARTNSVFLGSSVRSGTARVLIVATGRATAFGAIAARLKATAPETEFARGIRQFGTMLVRVMIFMVLFVLTVNALLGRTIVESLLFAVALAIGLSPELLPAIVSVTLSAGARTMAKSGVIVRRLEAIENLGSIDVLCTDKTGTLTEGRIALNQSVDCEGKASARVSTLAYLNAAFETGIDNPLDDAIVAAGKHDGLTTGGYAKVDEIPYDFARKRLTIVVEDHNDPAQHLLITKGAFDNVLEICKTVAGAGGEGLLDDVSRAKLQAFYRAKGEAGFRVLALATRKLPAKAQFSRADESDLCFTGLLLFLDPPKADARRTIADLARLGIAIKVVTGDNRYIAAHLAEAVGLRAGAMMTGDEVSALKNEALCARAVDTNLFVEVDPQQKEQIIRALKHMGHAVAYLGDGVNDAPALHAADVGISVDQAVDVARESADVILLQRDLGVLCQGIKEGRHTFANTLKYINITTSANFGNMISMALASPILPFLPLLPKQILLNNFLSDLPSMAISTDNVDAVHIEQAQRWSVKDVQRFMIVFGLASSAFDLITFAVLIFAFHAGAALFQTVWFVVSLLTELTVVLVLRTRGSAFRSRPSRLLLWATVAVTGVCLALPYLVPAASLFGFIALSPAEMAASLAIVAGYVIATEVAKRLFYRADARKP